MRNDAEHDHNKGNDNAKAKERTNDRSTSGGVSREHRSGAIQATSNGGGEGRTNFSQTRGNGARLVQERSPAHRASFARLQTVPRSRGLPSGARLRRGNDWNLSIPRTRSTGGIP